MFRTLGLRHLCVVNKHNQVLGIVTRADIVSIHNINFENSKVKGMHIGMERESSESDSDTQQVQRRHQYAGSGRRAKHEYLKHTIDLDSNSPNNGYNQM